MERDYDLFLSFRGEVRNNFACVLSQYFVDAGYKPFMDKEDVWGGDEFPPKILEAIGNCKSAIVIFSKDYTSSEWCLNELVLLLERRRATPATFFILPILYLLSAGDVKPGFCEEIDQNYKDKKYKDGVDDQQIEKWKKAIVEIGRTFFERFAEDTLVTHFAEDIVKLVQKKIDDMRTKRANTSKRPTKEQPSVVKPAHKGLQPSALVSTIQQHNQPVPTISTSNRSMEVDTPSPQVPIPHGKLDQGASSSQHQSPQIQHVPTSLDKRIGSTTSAKVVLYTSSGGVRSMVEDCRAVKNILEDHEVEFEERDAWTDEKFTAELKQLVGILSYPRLFVSGRDTGGLRKVEELRDNGELNAIAKPHKREEGNSWQTSSSNYSERKEEEEEKSGFSFTYKYCSPCKQAERTVYSKSKEKGGYL